MDEREKIGNGSIKNLKTSWQNYFWILKHVFLLLILLISSYFYILRVCNRDIFRQQDKVICAGILLSHSPALDSFLYTYTHFHYFSIFTSIRYYFFFAQLHFIWCICNICCDSLTLSRLLSYSRLLLFVSDVERKKP